jgi:hypothetical protein
MPLMSASVVSQNLDRGRGSKASPQKESHGPCRGAFCLRSANSLERADSENNSLLPLFGSLGMTMKHLVMFFTPSHRSTSVVESKGIGSSCPLPSWRNIILGRSSLASTSLSSICPQTFNRYGSPERRRPKLESAG